ncbi:hypothetical protein PG994_005219 [Apiospora phragmitis]|uniref:Uncharacterized protein n=1 Tax=Apiospora phragmitis TaxID=2905665 RepID=A0ABR1VST9_9PEZI
MANNHQVDENAEGDMIQVGIHEVIGGVKGGPRLCAFGISRGIAIVITGTYYRPNPTPHIAARHDRFLMHASDGMFLEAGLDKLEEKLATARAAGLLDLEAHILAPEPFSYGESDAVLAEPVGDGEAWNNIDDDGNGSDDTMEEVLEDPLTTNRWDEDEVRHYLDVQKALWERMTRLLRGGPVRWHKYAVCHKKGPYRWVHGMAVFGDKAVYCQSNDLNGESEEMRVVRVVEDGTEEEDSGLRCC